MQLPSNKTVLFFSPHCDDETIAAGALLSTLAKNNQVIVYYFDNSPRGVTKNISDEEKIEIRQNEAKSACKQLGCLAKFLNLDKSLKIESEDEKNVVLLKSILKENMPNLVLSLYEKDAHPTHQKTTTLVKKALVGNKIPLWLGEVWTPILQPNDAFFFDDELMNIKIHALSQYHSQIERTDWVQAIKSLNRYRALTLKETLGGFGSALSPKGKYAEAYQLSV